MCGIAGLIVSNDNIDISSVLKDMSDVIVHRGPDDEGFYETISKCGKYRIGFCSPNLTELCNKLLSFSISNIGF